MTRIPVNGRFFIENVIQLLSKRNKIFPEAQKKYILNSYVNVLISSKMIFNTIYKSLVIFSDMYETLLFKIPIF